MGKDTFISVENIAFESWMSIDSEQSLGALVHFRNVSFLVTNKVSIQLFRLSK